MKAGASVMAVLAALLAAPCFAQAQQGAPTEQEIAHAYRSGSGVCGGGWIPWQRWERRRIKDIRGWSLKFRRVGEERSPWMSVRISRAVAEMNGSCAEYRIRDFMPMHVNVQIKPSLTVEATGVRACR